MTPPKGQGQHLHSAPVFTYRSILEQRAVFADVQRADGRTVELDPGEKFQSLVKIEHQGLELVTSKKDPRGVNVPDANEEPGNGPEQ